jgi:hypothetical protein
MQRAGFLDGFGTEPNRFSDPNPDPLLTLVAGYDRARLEEYLEVVNLEVVNLEAVVGRRARC